MTMRAIALALPILAAAAAAADAEVVAYRVGKVITMNAKDEVLNGAVVLVDDGKFAGLGKAKDVAIPAGAKVVERDDLWLVPGFVEMHNHEGGGMSDLNDAVYLTNPGLRSQEAIYNNPDMMQRTRAGGVTAAICIPGSATNMGGFGTLIKFRDTTPGGMIVRSPGSLKIAQAGNPESYWFGVGRAFMNWNTRRTLLDARKYHLAWEAFEKGATRKKPEFNLAFEEFRPLFRRQIPVTVHTQIYQVVMTTICMLGRDLGLRVVLDHSEFDGYKTAPLLLDVGEDSIITVCGPRGYWVDTAMRKYHGLCEAWARQGVTKIGINTDSPVVPEQQLSYQAAMGCYYGYEPYKALAGLTRIGAEAAAVKDRMGSIETGKDADFALWTGDPLDPRSSCELTVIEGKVVYDAKQRRVW